MYLNPYLSFPGTCEEAFNFYAQVLNCKIEAMISHEGTPAEAHTPPAWRKKILHARLRVGDVTLMAGDAPPERHKKPEGYSVTVGTKTPEEALRIFKELSVGGAVQVPMEPTFFAKQFGVLTDRYGTPWMILCENPPPASS